MTAQEKARQDRARNDRIETLYNSGTPYREIAAQVGMSLQGVYRICHEKLGLPRRTVRA